MKTAELSPFLKLKSLHNVTVANFESDRAAFGADDIFCVGTGPSLRQTDLSLLSGQTVMYLNNAYSLVEASSPKKPIYVASDYLRFREIRSQLLRAASGPIYCSTDRIAQPDFPVHLYEPPCRFVMPRYRWNNDQSGVFPKIVHVGFSDHIAGGVYMGYSVVFSAIQIAYYLGAKRIILVGIDMDYSLPTGAYFSSEIKDNWPVFRYEHHARDHFIAVKQGLEVRGTQLLNATFGGAIDVLERVALSDITGH